MHNKVECQYFVTNCININCFYFYVYLVNIHSRMLMVFSVLVVFVGKDVNRNMSDSVNNTVVIRFLGIYVILSLVARNRDCI